MVKLYWVNFGDNSDSEISDIDDNLQNMNRIFRSCRLSGTLHTEKVIISLLQAYLGIGHLLFMYSFYNSIKLIRDLLDQKTYVTEKLRSNRSGNPPEVLPKKLNIIQFNTERICVLNWKDSEEILPISNEFNGLHNVVKWWWSWRW